MNYTSLHHHTEFSILDGFGKLGDIIAKAKKLGMHSLAITDHGNVYGWIKFYNLCKKEGIKPILGTEVYVEYDGRYRHAILLAQNQKGYQNILKLTTKACLENFKRIQ